MRNYFRFALALSATLAFAGCAVDPNTGDDTTDRVSESLSTLGAKLVGDLHYADGDNIYETLSLAANGNYTASWKPCPEMAKCASHLESGTWSTQGTSTLKLHPAHAGIKAFSLSIAGDGSGFKIAANGKTERLDRDGAPAGASCGFRTQTIPCEPGLECRWTGGPLDALHCAVPLAQAGDFCGGIAGIQCAAGLDCVLDGTYPDAGGTCQRHAGQVGEMCGGIAAFPCAKGLTCVLAGSYPDAAGTCTSCPIPSCAPPPAGCYYQASTPAPGSCPTGCGTLVCGGSGN